MNLDPELLQDFLTESGELLEQLDGDLVTLETTPEAIEWSFSFRAADGIDLRPEQETTDRQR
jgi:chemotaxis protein histidine kinase CheA